MIAIEVSYRGYKHWLGWVHYYRVLRQHFELIESFVFGHLPRHKSPKDISVEAAALFLIRSLLQVLNYPLVTYYR